VVISINAVVQNSKSKDISVLCGIADKKLADSEFSFTNEKTGDQNR
jgi:hypothetical protein